MRHLRSLAGGSLGDNPAGHKFRLQSPRRAEDGWTGRKSRRPVARPRHARFADARITHPTKPPSVRLPNSWTLWGIGLDDRIGYLWDTVLQEVKRA